MRENQKKCLKVYKRFMPFCFVIEPRENGINLIKKVTRYFVLLTFNWRGNKYKFKIEDKGQ